MPRFITQPKRNYSWFYKKSFTCKKVCSFSCIIWDFLCKIDAKRLKLEFETLRKLAVGLLIGHFTISFSKVNLKGLK